MYIIISFLNFKYAYLFIGSFGFTGQTGNRAVQPKLTSLKVQLDLLQEPNRVSNRFPVEPVKPFYPIRFLKLCLVLLALTVKKHRYNITT